MSTLTDILNAITSATSNTGAAQIIGGHLVQQNNMLTSVKALVSLATPQNAASISTQIAALPGVPTTVTTLLTELSEATTQQQVTMIGLQIEAAVSANSNVFGSILSAL